MRPAISWSYIGTRIGVPGDTGARMDLRQLRYFIAVAEDGSVLAASRKVHISQPALSNRIKELEAEIGAALFARHSRGVALTPVGERLLVEARRVMEALAQAQAVAQEAALAAQGLAIGASSTPRATIIPQLFDLYRQNDPGYRLNVQDVTSGTAFERLSNGDIDAALCYDFPKRTGLAGHPLYSEDLFLVGGRHRVDARKGDISFAELENVPLVLDHYPTPMRQHALAIARDKGIRLHIDLEAGPVDVLATVLSQNRCCTIAAYGLFAKEIARGELQARRICEPALPLTLSLVPGPSLAPAVAEVLLRRCRSIVRKAVREGRLGWRSPDGA